MVLEDHKNVPGRDPWAAKIRPWLLLAGYLTFIPMVSSFRFPRALKSSGEAARCVAQTIYKFPFPYSIVAVGLFLWTTWASCRDFLISKVIE